MPAVPAGSMYGQQGPTCFDRVKLGFLMGFGVGMTTGALFGGFSALRYYYLLKILACHCKLLCVA